MIYARWLAALLLLVACHPEKRWEYPFPVIGLALDGFPVTEKMLLQSFDETKLTPAILVFYIQWPSPAGTHASILSTLETIWSNGSVPCMTWEPMTTVDRVEKAIPYQDILDGKYDHYLDWMASEIKSWDKVMIIRFAQEMNLSRYHWGTSQEDYGPAAAAIYVSMFQYVATFFRNKHVDNVLWAFCPNADSVPDEDWNLATHYYPGDEYVDILGMDGYNWDIDGNLATEKGQTWSVPWRSFTQIFAPLYHQLKRISSIKPIIVFETASVNRANGNAKLIWMKEALETSKRWDIQGIVWFQVDKEEKWKFYQDKNMLTYPHQASFQSWLTENFNDFK